MACPGSGVQGMIIHNLPSDATDEYLRGMMAMVSTQVSSVLVEPEGRAGMKGFVTLSSAAEAERLVVALDGISSGAMMGKVLKVKWALRSVRSNESTVPSLPVPLPTDRHTSISSMHPAAYRETAWLLAWVGLSEADAFLYAPGFEDELCRMSSA